MELTGQRTALLILVGEFSVSLIYMKIDCFIHSLY